MFQDIWGCSLILINWGSDIMGKDELSRAIDRIRDKSIFSFRRVDNISEARVTPLILGVLYYYGWDVFDPYEVVPQYQIPKRHPIPKKYVDIA